MKINRLIAIMSGGLLLVAGSAFANDEGKYDVKHQNLSKRPYQAVPAESKKDNFEGATLINENPELEQKQKSMRLHMLGKRPYTEKNTD